MVVKQSLIPFSISLFLAFFATAFFPHIRLIPFALFIAYTIMEKPLAKTLWLAAACGFILDLIQSQDHFGTYALIYTLTTFLLFQQRRLLFFHKQFSLPFFTAIFALLSTILHYSLLLFTGTPPFASWGWLAADTFLTSLLDGTAAALFYTLPAYGYAEYKKWQALRNTEELE